MKTWAALIIFCATLVFCFGPGGTMSANAASSAQLRNTTVCEFITMEDFSTESIGRGAFEHVLSEVDVAALLDAYTGLRNYTSVKLFTTTHDRAGRLGSRDGMLVFGNFHGCAISKIPRRLTFISHVLGRDIVHPAPS